MEDNTRILVTRCIVWSAKISLVYFCIRIIGSLLLYSIFNIIFDLTVYQFTNILMILFLGLFGLAIGVMLKRKVPLNTGISVTLYQVGVIGILLVSLLSLVAWSVSFFTSAIDEIFLWNIWSDVVMYLLSIIALIGFGSLTYFFYSLFSLKLINGTTLVFFLLGLICTFFNLMTIFSQPQSYIFIIGLSSFLGFGWYLGCLQLVALIETGKDQPTAGF